MQTKINKKDKEDVESIKHPLLFLQVTFGNEIKCYVKGELSDEQVDNLIKEEDERKINTEIANYNRL